MVRWRPWLGPLTIVLLGLAGMGVGMAALDDDGPASPGVQLMNVQGACRRWATAADDGTNPSAEWCAEMTAWMFEQGAEHGATGSMMAGSPSRMRETCRQWALADPSDAGAAAEAGRWCDEMVAWMQAHMGEHWDDWMMHDLPDGGATER